MEEVVDEVKSTPVPRRAPMASHLQGAGTSLDPWDVDPQLVRRAASGEAEAFAAVYQQGFNRVYRFAVRRTSGRQEAEALTERILEQSFGQLDRYTGAVPFSAWLLGIAKRVWRAD